MNLSGQTLVDQNLDEHLKRWLEFTSELPLLNGRSELLQSKLRTILDENPKEPSTELAFQTWQNELKAAWREKIASQADHLFRSPLHHIPRTLPDGQVVNYTYERCWSLHFIEEVLPVTNLEHWQNTTVLTRGGGAAFFCLLQALENLYLPSVDKPLRYATWSLTPSCEALLAGRVHGPIRRRKAGKVKALYRSIRSGVSDAVILNTMAPDLTWRLDPEELIHAFRTRIQGVLLFLVLDVTQLGEAFSMPQLLDELGDQGPRFVFAFESKAESLQMGLGYPEVGRIRVWERRQGQNALAAIRNLLVQIRCYSGLGMSFREGCSLQLPSTWNESWRLDYLQDVAESTKAVAETLSEVAPTLWQPGSPLCLVKQCSLADLKKHDLPESVATRFQLADTEHGLRITAPALRGPLFFEELKALKLSIGKAFPILPRETVPNSKSSTPVKGPGVERRMELVHLQDTAIEIPIITIRGESAGPRLCVTAGIHGTEFLGVEALLTLADRIKPKELRGTLVLCPLANPPSFFDRRVFVSPLDGLNPNRVFPGNPDGQATERIIHTVFQHVVCGSDAYLDLHSGEFVEAVDPFLELCLSPNRELNRRSIDLAEALGIENIIVSPLKDRGNSVSGGHAEGIPTVLVEIGGEGDREPAGVQQMMAAVMAAMKHLGMLSLPEKAVHEPTFWQWDNETFAPLDGLWYPTFELGMNVEEGQALGKILDSLGRLKAVVLSKGSGRVFYGRTSMATQRGDVLVEVGYPVERPDFS